MRSSFLAAAPLALMFFACAKEAPPPATKDVAALGTSAAPAAKGKLALGAPIAAASPIALADVAKNPAAYKGKTITTTGTVTSVCQHMGCWMEIKDEASQAHVKMAGHDFFVPKTAAGRKAKVQGSLVAADDENTECNKEAADQMGHAVAKVQLEAVGVELDP